MATPVPVRLYGPAVPTTSEATLFTAKARTTIRSIVVAGDGTGGNVSLSVVPKGGTAGTGNRIATALAAAANTAVQGVPSGGLFVLNTGDFVSGLQSSGTHCTVTITGDSYGEA